MEGWNGEGVDVYGLVCILADVGREFDYEESGLEEDITPPSLRLSSPQASPAHFLVPFPLSELPASSPSGSGIDNTILL